MIEGDSEPTDADLEEVFASLPAVTGTGLTPAEQEELRQLEAEEAAAKAGQANRYTPEQITDYAKQLFAKGASVDEIETFVREARRGNVRPNSSTPPKTVPRRPTPEEIPEIRAHKGEDGIMTRIRESLSPLIGATDRQRAVQESVRRSMGREDAPSPLYERGVVPAVAKALRQPAAMATRIQGGVMAAAGGIAGAGAAGLSELAGQIVGGEEIDKGRIAQASTIGAVPLSGSAGVLAKVGNAMRMGGAGYAGEHVRSLVNEGELSGDAVKSGAVGAGLGLGASALGKVTALAKRIAGGAPKLGNSVKEQTLEAAREAGYVVPPYEVHDSALNRVLGSIAGKAATGQTAALMNQKRTNALAAQALELDAGTEITPAVLKAVRQKAAQPYAELDQLSRESAANLVDLQKARTVSSDPHEMAVLQDNPANKVITDVLRRRASADINELGIARDNARDAWKDYRINGGVERRLKAQEYSDQVERLEANLNKAAESYGRPELADNLRKARELYAKSYDVEAATNLGDANISAPILGRLYDKGRPLSGGLETVAKFQQAFPKNAVEAANVPSPGVSKVGASLGALLALGTGSATGNPAYTALAFAAPEVASQSARKFLLSPTGQRLLNQPVRSDPEVERAMARVAALMAMEEGEN